MKIAFDAKRAFHNTRGLGNYSRDTIRLLSTFYPDNDYLLFNPSEKKNIVFPILSNTTVVTPTSIIGKTFPALWRSRGMCNQLKQLNVDLYHGLSQELPIGIKGAGVKSIVTMHDAIFMRYPELYTSSYRAVFIQKNKYACRVADHIIAISEQTKRDIVKYFDADVNKVSVVYQGCNNIFRDPIKDEVKENVRLKYNLPRNFLLNVGAIEKRKNTGLIIEALHKSRIDIQLVIVGKPTDYINELKTLIGKYKLENQILFLHNVATADLPAIYSLAEIFVYPSIFEGFGIPILEALCTGTPVITSSGSCFEETGGEFTLYVNPNDSTALASLLANLHNNKSLLQLMSEKGLDYSGRFNDRNIANQLFNTYMKL